MPVGKKYMYVTFRVSSIFNSKLENYTGKRFDVYMRVSCAVLQVQKSPVFRRNGPDVHSDVMISVAQAILGGTAKAQGLYSTIDIAVRE